MPVVHVDPNGDPRLKNASPGYRLRVIPSCPECGAAGVPLMFGLPVPEARDAAEDGRLALGGCVVSPSPPNWQCPRRHRWRDADEQAWDDQLRTVLVGYGYGGSEGAPPSSAATRSADGAEP